MGGFDFESTGLDLNGNTRILTAALVPRYPGVEFEKPKQVVINPGVPIPPGATKIHGITDAFVAEHGKPPAETIEYIRDVLLRWCEDGVPIVGMNLAYDFTLLDRECRRYRMNTLSNRVMHSTGREISPVIDVLVIDRAVREVLDARGKPRRDGRKLFELAAYYKVALPNAHDAIADTIASMRIAWKLGNIYSGKLAMPVMELHQRQRGWHAAWCGESYRYIDPAWPVVPPPKGWEPPALPVAWSDATPEDAAALAGLATRFEVDKLADMETS